MIPPTVIVGVGGQGSTIALEVRRRLFSYASESEQAEFEKTRVQRYVRIFAVDTKYEVEIHREFESNTFILQPEHVDAWVRNAMGPRANDTFFREWWPRHIRQPGDFVEGAGALRVKGRLAYYLAGGNIASSIANAIEDLRDVRREGVGTLGPAQPVYVIVAGSISGGTGSGILLTLATLVSGKSGDVGVG